jgi:hypothetical protein
MNMKERDEPASTSSPGAAERSAYGVAMIALSLGSVGSLALLLNAGRRGTPKSLLLVMAIWVISPFVTLFVGNALSGRWSASTRAALYATMVLVALGSLIFYGLDTMSHIAGKPAAVYVLVPPVSWLVIAIAAAAAFASDRRARRRLGV